MDVKLTFIKKKLNIHDNPASGDIRVWAQSILMGNTSQKFSHIKIMTQYKTTHTLKDRFEVILKIYYLKLNLKLNPRAQ